jgi:hypothetical protein
VGLTHSLRNLIWFKGSVPIDSFYPRCFDCTIPEEFDEFITDFKVTKAASIIKTFVREMRESYAVSLGTSAASKSVTPELLKIASSICWKKVRD